MSRLVLGIVKLYKFISYPLLGDRCRFYPSCSEYMRDATVKHGLFKGLWVGSLRILRCNPFCKGGIDPVV